MYLTILKLLSPYLQRVAAKKAATYLQTRRERRLQQAAQDAEDAAEIEELLSLEATMEAKEATMEAKIPASSEEARQLARRNGVWFTLSSVVVGSAFGYALAYLLNRNK